MAKLLTNTGIEEPRIILDVGANRGDWTYEAYSEWPRAQIFAIEPSPLAHTELCKRMEKIDNVISRKLAIGAVCGEAVLFSNEPGSELSLLRQRRLEHFGISLSLTEKVTLSTLDDFVKVNGILEIDVLKIDVEGSKMEVLLGGEEVLRRVKVVQFEWGEASTGTQVHWVDFWYFFLEREMSMYRITPQGAKEVMRYHPRDEVMTWTNYLAVRKV